MRILIQGGTVVTADEVREASVLVEDGKIAAVGARPGGEVDRVIDASGRYVLPGGIDAHTHLDMPLREGISSADDFESGTVAAAFGGTTCVVDYAGPAPDGDLLGALDTWKAKAEGKAVVDYAFHMTLNRWDEGVRAAMADLVEAGVTSFKVFTAYPGRMMLDDGAIFQVLQRTKALGALTCVHAENGHVIDVLVHQALERGDRTPKWHARTRPALAEAEAVHRVATLAELAGAPVFFVHVSSAEAAEQVLFHRRRRLPVYAETCPQYLVLSDEQYEAPCLEVTKWVMSPPLRSPARQEELWRGLDRGDLESVGTDHCPFTMAQKAEGLDDFTRIPNGAPGIEHRLSLLWTEGVAAGRLDLRRFVEATSTAAAKRFGLWPRKGEIAVGSDADLVVWNGEAEQRISARTHHMRVDYSAYEGRVVKGVAETVLSRGEVIVEGGRLLGTPGRGRFVARQKGAWAEPEPVRGGPSGRNVC